MFSLYFQINIYFVYIKYVDDKLSSTSFDISVFFTVSQLLTQSAFLKPGLPAVPLPPFSHAHSLPHSGQTLRTSLLMTCFLYCCFSDTPDKTPSLISPTVCSFSLSFTEMAECRYVIHPCLLVLLSTRGPTSSWDLEHPVRLSFPQFLKRFMYSYLKAFPTVTFSNSLTFSLHLAISSFFLPQHPSSFYKKTVPAPMKSGWKVLLPISLTPLFGNIH